MRVWLLGSAASQFTWFPAEERVAVAGLNGTSPAEIVAYHFAAKHYVDATARQTAAVDPPPPWRALEDAGAVVSLDPRARAAPGAKPEFSALSSFLRLAAGITAWKSYDGVHHWALRAFPSSGNLQTMEV